MFLLVHLFWAAAFMLLVRALKRNPHPVPWPVLATGAGSSTLLDADHLVRWQDEYWRAIIPRNFLDLFDLHLRISDPAQTPLHFWALPVALLLLGIFGRNWLGKGRPYAVAISLGWMLHLALDGVVSFLPALQLIGLRVS